MNNSSAPLISIIVAVFNGANKLQQCIDSVVKQTYGNKELIVIDGGSRDGTVEILKANQSQISYWISESDKGIFSAWNKGLKQARGEWICFIGADDFFWDLQVLERMAFSLRQLPDEIRVAYAQIMLTDTDGNNLYLIGEPWQKIKERFLQIMCIPHPGTMHRRSLFEELGGFDESYHIAGDYELLLRELKTKEAFYIPELVSVAMRQGGISSNPENGLLAMQETRRAQRKNGQFFPGWTWMTAIARVYVRLLLWRILGERVTRKALDTYRSMLGLPSYWTRT